MRIYLLRHGDADQHILEDRISGRQLFQIRQNNCVLK